MYAGIPEAEEISLTSPKNKVFPERLIRRSDLGRLNCDGAQCVPTIVLVSGAIVNKTTFSNSLRFPKDTETLLGLGEV